MKVGGYVSNWTVQKTKAGLSPKVDDPEIKKNRPPIRSKLGGLSGSKWTVNAPLVWNKLKKKSFRKFLSGFCFQKWRWVIPPKYLFPKNVGNRLEFIIMDFVSVNDAPWPSQMALDFVSKNDARWDTRTFDCFQLWPSISSRDDVTHVTSHHARTPLPTPYLPHMTSLSYRHVWRHKWRKFIFGFCFHEWRWVKTPKCCQYGLRVGYIMGRLLLRVGYILGRIYQE